MDNTESLTKLGDKNTRYELNHPRLEMLECFENQHPHSSFAVTHGCFEFSSLCPKTGQPDFATLNIWFIPNNLLVETKSLKLYLFAFRNEGSFMETLTNRIKNDLVEVMKPRELTVTAEFNSRGGIKTKVVATYIES